MTRLSVVDAKTMERVLLALGFHVIRQKGSHVFYRHPDGQTTTVPHHPGRDLARPLIREVLREIELNPEQFRDFWVRSSSPTSVYVEAVNSFLLEMRQSLYVTDSHS
ncbi:MAG: hypothetical protein OJF51_001972 [Nitrospira sp.]|jgi:predicted RNA binding protein YcfA (HicA-like mRNA interferase family)|nr:MAG: hypothetical protein OJF51_001972 [Nitrospira sp.]